MPGPHHVDRAWERLDLPVMAAPFTAETVVVAPTVLPAAVAMVVMLMHHPSVRKRRLRYGDEQHSCQGERGNSALDHSVPFF